ncbi:MAG TPA: hypothetical protein VF132_02300 [Rudaea sp.]
MSVPQPPDRGSLGLGIALAWVSLIGGYVLSVVIASAIQFRSMTDGLIALLIALPWLLMLGVAIWFAANGRPRTALGVGVGIATIVAVALLLVAACFGLIAANR